jgi:hypothetical protein
MQWLCQVIKLPPDIKHQDQLGSEQRLERIRGWGDVCLPPNSQAHYYNHQLKRKKLQANCSGPDKDCGDCHSSRGTSLYVCADQPHPLVTEKDERHVKHCPRITAKFLTPQQVFRYLNIIHQKECSLATIIKIKSSRCIHQVIR